MIIKRKEFSNKKENEPSHNKKGLGHVAMAGLNGFVAQDLGREAIKTKGKGKLATVGAVLATGNTAYHTYKAGSEFRKGHKEKK